MEFNPILLWAVCLTAPGLSAQGTIRDFSFDLPALGGQKIEAGDFKDNVLIVDFWGTWCPPCRQALPGLIKLYRNYKHHGLEIVGLNYENMDDLDAAADKVRSFAAQSGITYQLALGTAEVQRQVPRFSGYPTMLLFKRGLEHDQTIVGYDPAREDDLEAWVRRALGLDADAEAEATEEEENEAPEEVPAGLIYRPGNADTGFDFELEDTDGRTLAFRDLRGKPVVLSITSSWDEEAGTTAGFLKRLEGRYQGRAAVLAAHIELQSDPEERAAVIREFRAKHDLDYRIFPVDLSFTRNRIHGFAGLPLLLVFDAGGTLLLRETGSSPEIHASVVAAVDEQIGGR